MSDPFEMSERAGEVISLDEPETFDAWTVDDLDESSDLESLNSARGWNDDFCG